MLQDHRTTITILTDCLRDSAAATVRAARVLGGLDPEGCSEADLYAMIPGIDEKFKAVKAGASNVKTLRDTIDIVRLKIEQVEKSGQGELPLAPALGPCTNCSTEMAACKELVDAESACCDTCIHPEVTPETAAPSGPQAAPPAPCECDGDPHEFGSRTTCTENPTMVTVEDAEPVMACRECGTAKADCDSAFMASESLCCTACEHPARITLAPAPAEAVTP